MSCVLNLVIFAVLWQKATSFPTSTSSTEATTLIHEAITVDYIISMGKGVEEIPQGEAHTTLLNLAYNHISSLPEFIFRNNSYKSLTKIELQQNKISNIHVSAFRGLKDLKTVVLSDNNITTLDTYTFRHNCKLEKLDLSRNKITLNRLRVFLASQTLETLTLSHNRIEQIYELSFLGLPSLKSLILDGNILHTIAEHSFKSLSKLQYLSLANTGVYSLSESMFSSNLPRIIDLQQTPLAEEFSPPLKKITNTSVRFWFDFMNKTRNQISDVNVM